MAAKIEDIWTKLESDRQNAEAKGTELEENLVNSTVIIVGDSGTGKSSLIQTFMNPKNTKDTKPTVALDFNFVRKTVNGNKSVGTIWEVGGDLSVTPKLLEIGLSSKNFLNSSVIITCDLSKPHNVLSSLTRNIAVVRTLVAKRAAELKSTNASALLAVRDRVQAPYKVKDKEKDHQDLRRIKLCEVPLYIVATKFDVFKSMNVADRKSLMQVIRFVAHYYSATIFIADKAGSGDGSLKDTFRAVLTSAAFLQTPKSSFETNIEKSPYVYITRGKDSFQHILMQTQFGTEAKSRLITSDADFDLYIAKEGATKECWQRVQDHMTALFGPPDPAPSAESSSSSQMETGADDQKDLVKNPFPEPEIDEMRVMADVGLERMIQENLRKQEMLSKMSL